MLSLTRKTDYALVALAYLGERWHQQAGPVSAKTVAEMFGLPQALLMNILKELTGAKLLTSTRGATGGYTLAYAPQRITLLEVVTATEGEVQFTPCADELPIVGQGCPLECNCPIRNPIRRLNQRLKGFLEEMTLQDLLDDREPDGTENKPVQLAGSDAHP